ncbi:unnamed protein product [Rotaria sordida]|uniref:Uncharacterized protein n=1 Tax=Rotaria sordida TaxID=392033 RepID=A0A816DSU1_9BILA|nr:unnamed protein product [Rotaria sordida]CAF1641001.1 unnamed protein product [Rotaria sordida]
MANGGIKEQVLYVCELVKENQLNEAVGALQSVNTDDILCSSDLISLLISIEQTAFNLLQDCLNNVDKNTQSRLKYIEQVGLFNQSVATKNTNDKQQINVQIQVLLNVDILQNLVTIIDTLRTDDHFHRHDFVICLCIWLEAIAHFIHRHDNLVKELIEPLRQSVLSCVLSDWYQKYLTPSIETNIPARHFFIRTCSFVTGVLQCNQLSFENALKTIQSYKIVESIGQKIFDVRLADFHHYLFQLKDIENDRKCLTGICFLMTNCYNVKAFINNDEYFNLLLQLLKSDFVRKNLFSTWTNESTILADTLMVQLKNCSNEPSIRLYLQQNNAADAIHNYMHADYDRLRLQACMLLGVLLDDETMRQLKIPGDELTDLYFDAIRQAHQSSNKCYKRVPIHLLFRALSSLVHNQIIQASVATSTNYFDYLISMSDDYNLVYDIFWTLSFNTSLHEKFHSHKTFLQRLQTFVNDPESVLDKDIVRSAEGILWNLNHRNEKNTSPEQSTNVENKNTQLDKY